MVWLKDAVDSKLGTYVANFNSNMVWLKAAGDMAIATGANAISIPIWFD